jgi:hypothetical protein
VVLKVINQVLVVRRAQLPIISASGIMDSPVKDPLVELSHLAHERVGPTEAALVIVAADGAQARVSTG